jgi:hypothetical protein
LVERGNHVRSFHVKRADSETVKQIVRTNVSRESALMTDESKLYTEGRRGVRQPSHGHTFGG